MLVSADSQWLAGFPLPWDSHCAWAKLHLQSTPSSSKCPQGRKWLACEPRLTSKLQYLVRISSTVLRNLKTMISDHFLAFSSCCRGRVGIPPPTTSNSGRKFSPVATLPFQPVPWIFLVFLPHLWRLLLTLLCSFHVQYLTSARWNVSDICPSFILYCLTKQFQKVTRIRFSSASEFYFLTWPLSFILQEKYFKYIHTDISLESKISEFKILLDFFLYWAFSCVILPCILPYISK